MRQAERTADSWLDRPPDWSGTGHFVILRDETGKPSDPIPAAPGPETNAVALGAAAPFAIFGTGRQEPTHYAFGNTAQLVRDFTVQAIEPRAGGGFDVRTSAGSILARRVVNAAGVGAARVAALVGLNLPIVGHALQVNVTEPWEQMIPGLLIQHVGRRLTLKQTQYGRASRGWVASSPAECSPSPRPR